MKINKGDRWLQGHHEFEYFKFGEHALLLQWAPIVNRNTLERITAVTRTIEHLNIHGVIELVPAYHSLTIFFNPSLIRHESLVDILDNVEEFDFEEKKEIKVIDVEVVYHPSVAPDLESVAHALHISIDEVIELHSAPIYDVYFIGFLPGFLYLGGLNKKLHIPRKATPRIRVPAGSVAIAGMQTGIYPLDSPGGWHIIGHTSKELFNPVMEPPCPILPGMRIKFQPINL